ncbi:MAG: serine--tRNA ligase [Patescibacteria group bacterium]|jgi:seryl-tRNA synthetase
MIDYKDFIKNSDRYFNAYRKRGGLALEKTAKSTLKKIQETQKPNLLTELEKYQSEINQANKQITALDPVNKKKKIIELKKLSDKISKLKTAARQQHEIITKSIKNLPNILQADVPPGIDASSNKVLRKVGDKPKIQNPKDYLALSEKLEIIDIERAAKVSGSRFGYIKAEAALLEFALIQYSFSKLIKQGFTPIVPPVIINQEFMEGMGYLAQGGEEEVYHLVKDNQYLVGTAEQSVGPYFANELILEKDLPKKFIAFSSCFRREAGSHGKDTKGILRVHQFDKLEMFVFCKPEDSESQHQKLLKFGEELVKGLGLPYQVVQLCAGDLGFPSSKTYDIECWMPGQNQGKGEYRETHSTSNTTDFQARALNIRFKAKDGKNCHLHMINGTAFAIGRILIAILENYQQPNGDILIPGALQPFMHGISKITKK